MALRDAIDLTALGWVKPDLDELLRQARVAVEASEDVDAGEDAEGMRECAGLLHQARGTLRMLDLTVPALVAEEMERVAQALGDGKADERSQALAVLHRGVTLLPDYLERLQGGHREIPIVLLPLINELRGARGAEPIGEGALFEGGFLGDAHNDDAAPTEAEIAHAQGSLSGQNRSVLDAVSSVLKEDLHRIQDALDLYLRSGRDDITELTPQIEALDRAADTVAMLGLGPTREVLLEKRDALQALVDGSGAGESQLLGIAGGLLQAHAALDQRVHDLAGEPGEGGGTLEFRELVSALGREAVANFSSVRQGLVGFVESAWEHEQLAELPRLFNEVSGGLRMLEMPEPAQTTDAIRAYIERELLKPSAIPGARQLDTLADAISSLEYYLEMLAARGDNRADILAITRDSLEALGYWPIPEQLPAMHVETVVAPQPQATPAAEAARPTVADVPSVAPPVAVGGGQGGFELAGDDIDDEIREVFLEEFAEEIDNLGRLIPAWHKAPADLDRLRPIRRVFHTLKGSGRLVGALSLGEFSWKVENMLNRVLDETRPASPAVLSLVDHAHGMLPRLHAALRGEAMQGDELGAIQSVADRLAAGEEVEYTAPPVPAPADAPADAVPAADGIPTRVEPVLLEILDVEVGGHLQTMDAWVARAGDDGRVDDALMRAVHTMSGAFAMAEVPAIGEVLLPAESLIKRLLAAAQPADADAIEALTDLSATVRTTLAALQTESPRVRPHPELAERMRRLRDALPEPSREVQRYSYEAEDSAFREAE
ncbi:MAG: Hpt domain-containing protein, partial [Pseudoxanthomonas suwonensis]|nr:Hpt domain-containing protein [Pseudoxanthomonas suwonensis]